VAQPFESFWVLANLLEYDGICVFIVVVCWKGGQNTKKFNGISIIILAIFFYGIFVWKMWHFVASQYVASDIHFLFGLVVMFPFMEAMQSLLKFAQKRNAFIYDFIIAMKVCKSQLYTLYCDNILSFQGYELWSFHGLIQCDH
jgi:hypothetical protein